MGINDRILVVPDLHCPYMHRDAVDFLDALRLQFSPTRIVQLGDEIDGHSFSFHEHDPDLASPGLELIEARRCLTPLFQMFPEVDVIESNHGSLVFRRAKAFGLPSIALKSYREIIGAPEGWKWHDELIVRLSDGSDVCFHHGRVKNHIAWSKSIAMHTVNGHFHEDFAVRYWRSPRGLFWSVVSGCLIDFKSLAFAYNKLNLLRPILGATVIIDSMPLLMAMRLKSNGRWTGRLT